MSSQKQGLLVLSAVATLVVVGALVIVLWPQEAPQKSADDYLRDVLEGETAAVRAGGAQGLLELGKQARAQIRRAIEEYEDGEVEVLLPLIRAVQRAEAWRGLPRLFDLMESTDRRIRGRAGAAAQQLMGAAYGFAAGAAEPERAAVIARMREAYEIPSYQARLQEFYGK